MALRGNDRGDAQAIDALKVRVKANSAPLKVLALPAGGGNI
jgi:hypothetical protein